MLPAGEDEFEIQFKQVPGPEPSLYWLTLH